MTNLFFMEEQLKTPQKSVCAGFSAMRNVLPLIFFMINVEGIDAAFEFLCEFQ